MPTTLVTGGAGFIGSHVAGELLARDHRVVVLDDLSGGFADNVPGDARLITGNINDVSLIESLFNEYRFDYVYHLAAYAAEGLSHFIKRFNYQNNLMGSVNLINAAINHGTRGFVFTSSIAVYGASPQLPMTEETPPHPEDPYGIAKLAVEQELEASRRMFGLDYVIFRPHNVYGERQNIGDRYRNVVGIFMNQILQGRPMTVFGDGTQTARLQLHRRCCTHHRRRRRDARRLQSGVQHRGRPGIQRECPGRGRGRRDGRCAGDHPSAGAQRSARRVFVARQIERVFGVHAALFAGRRVAAHGAMGAHARRAHRSPIRGDRDHTQFASGMAGMNPRVMAVILNTNRREDTLACLASLQRNTYPDLSTIVLDNASTDGSVETIRAAYPDVRIIASKRTKAMPATTTSASARMPEGADWMLVLNEDTVLAPECIERLVATGESDPRIAFVGPLVLHYDEPEIIQSAGVTLNGAWDSQHLGQNEPDRGQFALAHETPALSGCTLLVRAAAIREFGALDERFFYYFEETEWCVRALTTAGRSCKSRGRASGTRASSGITSPAHRSPTTIPGITS